MNRTNQIMLALAGFAIQLSAAVSVDSSAQIDSLAATNGNKVVSSGGRLHIVYGRNGAIFYSSSPDSQTWTSGAALPGTVGSGASQPTIAAGANGTTNILGVVYKDAAGWLQYQSCQLAGNGLCGKWNGPYAVQTGSHPSLVALQTNMYLTASAGGIVTFTRFDALSNSPKNNYPYSGGAPEYVFYDGSTCYQHSADFPAVTVIPLPSPADPEIRVSWLQKSLYTGYCGSYNSFIGVFSARRHSTGAPWTPPESLYSTAILGIPQTQMYSLSAAANAKTGEQFVAASFTANSSTNQKTMVFRRSQTDPWFTPSTPLLNQVSLIDIESDGAAQIRIAYTIPSNSAYNLFYQTGSWKVSNAGPTWSSPPVSVLVGTAATSPQASFWIGPYACMADGSTRAYITPAFYARNINIVTESVEVASGTVLGPAMCLPAGGPIAN